MQRIKTLLTKDDAVSPVIGVILMVAITVILAAVIASFVLGLGDTADDVQPNSNFAFDYEQDSNVTITLTDGEAIDEDEIFIRGEGVDDDFETGDLELSDDEWNVGESTVVGENVDDSNDGWETDLVGGEEINVVWEESGGDSAATLGTFEVPDNHND